MGQCEKLKIDLKCIFSLFSCIHSEKHKGSQIFCFSANCNAVVYNNMHAKSYTPQAHN